MTGSIFLKIELEVELKYCVRGFQHKLSYGKKNIRNFDKKFRVTGEEFLQKHGNV
jgi:hypothetical protein